MSKYRFLSVHISLALAALVSPTLTVAQSGAFSDGIFQRADMTTENIVRVTSYLRDASFAEANGNARVAALGPRRVPTTAIVAATLAVDWLVEIEIIAIA